jgi:parallel beta-helix repeat protein
MTKTKSYAKPIYLMVAVGLVFSMGAVAVLMVGTARASPGTIHVNVNDPACVNGTGQADPYACVYCSIQDAIYDAGTSGDTILVHPGKYDENIVIGARSLALQSTDGWQETTIDPLGNIVWVWGDADVTVQGFEITGGNNGIYITDVDSEVHILDCFVHDNVADGIRVEGGGDLLHIEGNRIAQNGECGISMTQAWNTTNIFDNVIGAWTYYPGDYGGTGDSQRYGGNGGEGILISEVGETATVVIQHNRISENAHVDPDTGIHIQDTYGVLTIAHNDIGAWEDAHGENYLGNEGAGIYIYWVYPGAVLTIGPDNGIRENTGDGIEIFNAQPAGAATVTIHHNGIHDNGSDGIELGTPCEVDGATISHNTITGHVIGIHMTGPSDHNIISDNEINNNSDGIWIEGHDNQVLRNNITNNVEAASGIHLTGTALGNIIRCNNFEGNLPYGVYNENVSEVVNATKNWWGDASGPSGVGPGSGDAVSENVTFEPWLPMQFQDCPECVGTPAPPVGGEAYTVAKLAIIAPWIVLAVFLAGTAGWYIRRRRMIQS